MHPLSQGLILLMTHVQTGPKDFSLPYLFLTHVAFGFTGSLIGLGLAKTKSMRFS